MRGIHPRPPDWYVMADLRLGVLRPPDARRATRSPLHRSPRPLPRAGRRVGRPRLMFPTAGTLPRCHQMKPLAVTPNTRDGRDRLAGMLSRDSTRWAEADDDEPPWSHLHPFSRFQTLFFFFLSFFLQLFKACLAWNNVLFVSDSSVSSLCSLAVCQTRRA